MTQRSDIERVLDIWLADGPIHVPDRVFDDAVAAVYRAPQRSPWRLRWRNLTVSNRLLAAAVAALAIVTVGVALTALAPTSDLGASPSPSAATSQPPTARPTAAACATTDPTCTGPLAAGAHRTANLLVTTRFTVPEGWSKDLDVPGALNLLWSGASDSFIAVWPDWQIASQTGCSREPEPGRGRRASDLVDYLATHPGLITTVPEEVTLGGLRGYRLDARMDPEWTGGPCTNEVQMFTHVGTIDDVGWITMPEGRQTRYWFLEAGDGHTVHVALDAASEALAATFFAAATPIVESMQFSRLAECVDSSACLGALEAGTYTTGELEIPLTFTVPEGWANDWDVPLGYALIPEGAEASEPGIFVFLDVYASNQEVCSRQPAAGVGRTAADLAAWLGTLPDVTLGAPEAVTVGGLTGTRVDVSVVSGGPVCSPGDYQLWVSDYGPLWWGLTPGHPQRHYLLDLPGRHNVLIVVPAPEAEFDALVASVEPIIASFAFAP